MGGQATFHIFTEHHDGAFLTGWGAPQFKLPAIARWAESCSRNNQLPSATNYAEYAEIDPDEQFTDSIAVDTPDTGALDYRYELTATTTPLRLDSRTDSLATRGRRQQQQQPAVHPGHRGQFQQPRHVAPPQARRERSPLTDHRSRRAPQHLGRPDPRMEAPNRNPHRLPRPARSVPMTTTRVHGQHPTTEAASTYLQKGSPEMDPNEALREFLSARAAADTAADIYGRLEEFERATEAANNLHIWLSNGGFQPDWRRIAGEVLR